MFAGFVNPESQQALAQADLREAIRIIQLGRACLLCFERDCRHCHRSIIAERITAETGARRRDLGVQHGLARVHDRPLRFPAIEASFPA